MVLEVFYWQILVVSQENSVLNVPFYMLHAYRKPNCATKLYEEKCRRNSRQIFRICRNKGTTVLDWGDILLVDIPDHGVNKWTLEPLADKGDKILDTGRRGLWWLLCQWVGSKAMESRRVTKTTFTKQRTIVQMRIIIHFNDGISSFSLGNWNTSTLLPRTKKCQRDPMVESTQICIFHHRNMFCINLNISDNYIEHFYRRKICFKDRLLRVQGFHERLHCSVVNEWNSELHL